MSNGRCVLGDYERERIAVFAREQVLADREDGLSYSSPAQVVAAAREEYEEREDEWVRAWVAAFRIALAEAEAEEAEEDEENEDE